MKIQVLGTGCAKCKQLQGNVERAVREAGVAVEVEKVEDFAAIVRLGVMTTPALVIDGQVKATGRVLSAEEVKALLKAQ